MHGRRSCPGTTRLNSILRTTNLNGQKKYTTEISAHQARWDRARGEANAREHTKNCANQAADAREQYLHPTGGAISNQSGESFDILTLQYHNTPGGQQLQQQVCDVQLQ